MEEPMRVVHFQTDIPHVASGETVYAVRWHADAVKEAGFRVVSPENAAANDAIPFDLHSETDPADLAAKAVRPKVSVVICTRDRAHHLKECLASLPNQSFPPDEVIVVDNASVDIATWEVTQAAGVTYVREDRPGLDIARNTGARKASGDLVVYTDDDTILHPQWLERTVAAFDRNPDAMAITGLVLPLRVETLAQQIFEAHWSFGRGFEEKLFEPADFDRWKKYCFPAWDIGAGANMAFRKSAFETYGYFDEALDVGAAGCSGDSEYWYRIVGMGGICLYDPSAIVFHHHREDEAGLRSQLRAYLKGHTAALRVQGQRFPKNGNLRRRYVTLPTYFVQRLIDRLRHGRRTENWFLLDEIRGYLEGMIYPLGPRREALK